jgi:hypothetical protein
MSRGVETKADADRVAQAEATSELCHALFDIPQSPDPSGVLSFEPMKTYE